MKLLLDEMWSPAIAVALRRRGHDVVAVKERSELRGKPDPFLLELARFEGRAFVTNNVQDFRPLAEAALSSDAGHAGLVLTSDHSMPRRDPRTLGRMVSALDALLAQREDAANEEIWLA